LLHPEFSEDIPNDKPPGFKQFLSRKIRHEVKGFTCINLSMGRIFFSGSGFRQAVARQVGKSGFKKDYRREVFDPA
jgi:hypothetical protein